MGCGPISEGSIGQLFPNNFVSPYELVDDCPEYPSFYFQGDCMNIITAQEEIQLDQFESIIHMMIQCGSTNRVIVGFEWDEGYALTWQIQREYLWELEYRSIEDLHCNVIETLTFVASDDYYESKFGEIP